MRKAFRTPLTSSAFLLTLGVVLAACGGTSPSPAASDSASASTVADNAATGNPASASTVADQNNGQGAGNSGDSEFGLPEAEIVKRVDAVEQSIATCMSDAGFEYVAVDYATARQAMDADSKPSGLDPDQFRSEFGYGITTLYGGAATQATIGLGRNIAIRDGLPAADRVAWERQLFGDNSNQTFVVGLDEEDLSGTGGCTRQAVEQNFSADELGAGFVNYQNAEGARIDQDARVIAAYQDWATCMRDAGYNYNAGDEIDADLASRLDSITQGLTPAELSSDAQAALSELQGEERAIAAVDHDCDVKFVADITAQVTLEILGPDAGQ